jgi:hypothetical protein
VGASDWGELSTPSDTHRGEVRFVVESDYQSCRIRDPRDSGAIYVNGKPIREQTLVDGDIIVAGELQFRVSLEESSRRKSPEPHLPALAVATVSAAGAPTLAYESARCESGLMRFSGSEGAAAAVKVAQLLSVQHALYLIVDPAKSGCAPEPTDPGSVESETTGRATPAEKEIFDLFDQRQAPAALGDGRSLLVFTPQDAIDRFALLAQAWNKQAAVAIFSPCEPARLLKELRKTALWLYPPDLIGQRLANCPPSQTPRILKWIKAVLVETEHEGGWSVYASAEIAPLWAQLGFPHAPGTSARSAAIGRAA